MRTPISFVPVRARTLDVASGQGGGAEAVTPSRGPRLHGKS
jgi:hypothetical protein